MPCNRAIERFHAQPTRAAWARLSPDEQWVEVVRVRDLLQAERLRSILQGDEPIEAESRPSADPLPGTEQP